MKKAAARNTTTLFAEHGRKINRNRDWINRMEWPADTVERRDVAALAPYAKNARTHSEAQVEQIAASIREWGFTMPVLVDEAGEIIAGHGRIMAASLLGLDTVPVMTARGWTQKQIKAYRLADNQLALNGAWDVKLLAAEIGELQGLESLMGFSADDLVAIMQGDIDMRPLPGVEQARKTLAERFGIPPFSVLNAREGWWQERKRAWIALGIQSELGRGEIAESGANSPRDQRAMADGLVSLRAAQKAGRKANATVSGSPMPATDYRNNERGDGRGRAMPFARNGEQDASKKTGLTVHTTVDPYRAEKRAGKKETAALTGGLTYGLTQTPFGQERQNEIRREQRAGKKEKTPVTPGNGWANGGPARRDPAFYAKKRQWEKANGRAISTTEFREKYWDGYEKDQTS